MVVITITKSKKKLIKDIANYYSTTPDKIEIDEKDHVWCHGRKKKLQEKSYKICFFV